MNFCIVYDLFMLAFALCFVLFLSEINLLSLVLLFSKNVLAC